MSVSVIGGTGGITAWQGGHSTGRRIGVPRTVHARYGGSSQTMCVKPFRVWADAVLYSGTLFTGTEWPASRIDVSRERSTRLWASLWLLQSRRQHPAIGRRRGENPRRKAMPYLLVSVARREHGASHRHHDKVLAIIRQLPYPRKLGRYVLQMGSGIGVSILREICQCADRQGCDCSSETESAASDGCPKHPTRVLRGMMGWHPVGEGGHRVLCASWRIVLATVTPCIVAGNCKPWAGSCPSAMRPTS